MKEKIHKFWLHLAPTLGNMVLQNKVHEVHPLETQEVLSYLPDLTGQKVLEIASGIGRFTGYLAQKAKYVETLDYVPNFVEENQKTHKHLSNISYSCADAHDLDYPDETFDFIFINWLFLYFSDEELSSYFEKLSSWLKPHGHLFFRESCFHDIRNYEREDYAAIFRFQHEYETLAKKHFRVQKWGMIESYMKCRDLANQFYWLCQKKG